MGITRMLQFDYFFCRLRTLLPKFMKLPELAVHCALFDLVPPNDVRYS